ncbi:HD domain-containing protein [soil metagenome]
MAKVFEFRCPIHGFIELDEWERDIVSQPAFQRLRRIRQLAWTDYVYPGAMHTRFEHSLGVMHTATRIYDAIAKQSKELLESAFGINEDGLRRERRLVRLAALLHDVGHGPFSHAVEGLLPVKNGRRYDHEDYSAEIIRVLLADVIDHHPMNSNYGWKADDVANYIAGGSKLNTSIFWREIISSQMDADRMDYLLRDAYHMGVTYGHYDLDRLINTMCAVEQDDVAPRVGVTEGGWHAAESLVMARYYMFTQVYFHRTRVAYDHHISQALKACVPATGLPKPDKRGLEKYLQWDDWKVLGRIAEGKAGDHGRRLKERDHYRVVYNTPESASIADIQKLERVQAHLGDLIVYEAPASKSWYKVDQTEIPVRMEQGGTNPLSVLSAPVMNIGTSRQVLLYSTNENKDKARKRAQETT